MTATYDNGQLSFQYPENWKLQENPDTSEFTEIALESPSGCIWSVSLFPADTDPRQLLETTATALREQYEDFESSATDSLIEDQLAPGFRAHFYCLDFLVTAQAQAFKLGSHTIHILAQAESREFDQFEPVFEAITVSLLHGKASAS